MSGGNWASHWIDWRKLRGDRGIYRRKMDEWLKTHPALLYFGDSWFSTPLYPNLARQSIEAIEGIAMIVGRPGGTTGQLLGRKDDKKIKKIVERIEHGTFDVMLISLGGNDALGRLKTIFRAWTDGNPAPLDAQAAFERVIGNGVFGEILGCYERLLARLKSSTKLQRDFQVIGHGYAPLIRIGVPADLTVGNIGAVAMVIDDVGPWIFGPMKKVFDGDENEARRFSRLLLEDGFRDMVLQPLKSRFGELFTFVEFGDIAALRDDSAWYDEIHPATGGFAAMVPTLNSEIRKALPSGKSDKVSL